jgi:hypothetical protein
MAILVFCVCGKRFDARDEYAGRQGLCPACKRIFDIPIPGEPTRSSNELEPVAATAAQSVVSIPPAESHTSVQEVPGTDSVAVGETRRPFWRDPIIVIGATVPSLILFGFGVYLYRDYSAKQFLREVYEAKKTADSQAASETSRRRAFASYESILSNIKNRNSTDPMLKKYEHATGIARDKLYPLVKAELDEEELQRRAQKEAEKVAAEVTAEADRLGQFTANYSGGAWVINKLGKSDILRGLEIAVLKRYVDAGAIADVLKEARSRAAFSPSFYRSSTADKHSADESAERLLLLAPKHPVDLREVYKICRTAAYGSRNFDGVIGDALWPRVVAKLQVRKANTSIEARYKLEGIKGGQYYLYAMHSTSHALVEWMSPITVDKSGDVSFDFFNGSADLIMNKDE